jgi:hypothetical protein
VVLDAASFLVAAALLVRLPALAPTGARSADGPSTLLGEARAGLGYLWSHRALRIILLGYCGVVAANGIDDVALVLLGTDDLRASQSGGGVAARRGSASGCWWVRAGWPAGRGGCR